MSRNNNARNAMPCMGEIVPPTPAEDTAGQRAWQESETGERTMTSADSERETVIREREDECVELLCHSPRFWAGKAEESHAFWLSDGYRQALRDVRFAAMMLTTGMNRDEWAGLDRIMGVIEEASRVIDDEAAAKREEQR